MKKSIGAKTIVHPTPVFVVGSYDKEGKPNVMTAAWGGICSSVPPCLSVSLREATYTHRNILEHHAFTVSIPTENYVKEADFFGITSGREVDKFQATGLTPVRSAVVDAPYVEEFPFILECKLLKSVEIGGHTQFIGEIMDIKVEEDVVNADQPFVEEIKPLMYSPDNIAYYGVGNFLGKAFSMGKLIKK